MLLHVIAVTALVGHVVNLLGEGLVEREETLPVVNEWDSGD